MQVDKVSIEIQNLRVSGEKYSTTAAIGAAWATQAETVQAASEGLDEALAKLDFDSPVAREALFSRVEEVKGFLYDQAASANAMAGALEGLSGAQEQGVQDMQALYEEYKEKKAEADANMVQQWRTNHQSSTESKVLPWIDSPEEVDEKYKDLSYELAKEIANSYAPFIAIMKANKPPEVTPLEYVLHPSVHGFDPPAIPPAPPGGAGAPPPAPAPAAPAPAPAAPAPAPAFSGGAGVPAPAPGMTASPRMAPAFASGGGGAAGGTGVAAGAAEGAAGGGVPGGAPAAPVLPGGMGNVIGAPGVGVGRQGGDGGAGVIGGGNSSGPGVAPGFAPGAAGSGPGVGAPGGAAPSQGSTPGAPGFAGMSGGPPGSPQTPGFAPPAFNAGPGMTQGLMPPAVPASSTSRPSTPQQVNAPSPPRPPAPPTPEAPPQTAPPRTPVQLNELPPETMVPPTPMIPPMSMMPPGALSALNRGAKAPTTSPETGQASAPAAGSETFPGLGTAGPAVLGSNTARTRPGSTGEAPVTSAGMPGGVLANNHRATEKTYTQRRKEREAAQRARLKRGAAAPESEFSRDLTVSADSVLEAPLSLAQLRARAKEVPGSLRPSVHTGQAAPPGRTRTTPDQAPRRATHEATSKPTSTTSERIDEAAWEVATPGGPVVAKQQARKKTQEPPPTLNAGA
ncbi:hypothetical protein ABZ639_26110 [Saccharomonospora sp. NPDC006951]